MAEKAIERFSPTSALNELGDRYHYMIEQPSGSWMRYDAELVRDAMRYRTLRILPSNRVVAMLSMAPDEMDRVLDRTAAIYAEHGAIDTAISHSGRAQR